MKNIDELIAQLTQLHIDNEKRIDQNSRRITEMENQTQEMRRQTEAIIYWVMKPWWKKILGIR